MSRRPKPICTVCGDTYAIARLRAGYRLCLMCGEDAAKAERTAWCIAPMNKSNYMLFTDISLLKQLNPKRTT